MIDNRCPPNWSTNDRLLIEISWPVTVTLPIMDPPGFVIVPTLCNVPTHSSGSVLNNLPSIGRRGPSPDSSTISFPTFSKLQYTHLCKSRLLMHQSGFCSLQGSGWSRASSNG